VLRLGRLIEEGASAVPLHPFLLAAYPVLFLYSNNLADASPGDVVVPLALTLGGTVAAFAVLSFVWRAPLRAAIVVSAVVVPFLLFERILRLPPADLHPSRQVLMLAYVAFVVAAAVFAVRARARLRPATLALNVVALVLVTFTLPPIAGGLIARGEDEDATEPAGLLGPASARDRDIWFLVFDRYGSAQSLALEYGITDNDLWPWLSERGFQVLEGSRANYNRTNLSLSATLNMEMLDELAALAGTENSSLQPINRALRDNRVAELLQQRGYRYVHVGSWFEPTRAAPGADEILNPETVVSFASTVYDITALPYLTRTLGLRPPKTFAMKHADSARFQLERLREQVAMPGPKFVFAHVLLPHHPYVFLEDGTFAPAKATFASQLRYTNALIKELVARLLTLPEEELPIIVLQADEGPAPARYDEQKEAFDWPNATPEELAVKFGILNAMFLPDGEGVAPVPESLSAVNTFRMLFRRYFGADLPDLPDLSYVSSRARPYDLIDVTARILPP
jgi:hypothetical protein